MKWGWPQGVTGRVDDVVIVSGHNLGTAPIEDAINEHPAVAESAIVGFPHGIKRMRPIWLCYSKRNRRSLAIEESNQKSTSRYPCRSDLSLEIR
jgi:acyl-coenzyme A synthetase/AMP-(fatty) acid ligase